MDDRLRDYQVTYARPSAEVKRWKHEGEGNSIGLAEVVRQVKPTMLIGASTAAGAFTEAIVREMAAHADRPIIFPLSNPAPMAEAAPADLIAWTEGRALIATGSSFPPVTYRGVTYVIGQVNNAMLYPGLCLGAIVSRARRISDSMFAAAANAVSSLVAVRLPGASLLPHVDDLRSVSLTVAVAVAEAAVAEGLAGVKLDDIVQQVKTRCGSPSTAGLKRSEVAIAFRKRVRVRSMAWKAPRSRRHDSARHHTPDRSWRACRISGRGGTQRPGPGSLPDFGGRRVGGAACYCARPPRPAVSDLQEGDFTVYEDHILQPIGLFRHEDIPVVAGLLVDHSGSMAPKLAEVIAGAGPLCGPATHRTACSS